MVVSWSDASGPADRIKTVIFQARSAPPQPEAAARGVDDFGNQWKGHAGPDVPPDRPAPATASRPPQSAGSDAELLRAFLAGAGVPDLKLPPLSPKLMEIFGQLLREATKGTLDLLAARAITKRELRADVTVIVAAENNPLKFSPNVEAAMSHLLSPQGRGFMTPLRAMRDAYDDLRAHQFAFIAGMRAALAGVLARFDPGALEHRLTEKSMIDSVLPMNRKAKLWALFEQLHSDIQREAEDDFDALFGREFLRAYEAQLARLEREGKNRGA
jgi:FHA domain-containing protein